MPSKRLGPHANSKPKAVTKREGRRLSPRANPPASATSPSTARRENPAAAAKREMKRKQGGSDEDARRCPPHHAFVFGCCLLCGVKKEDAEGGAPGVAVGHETLKQGGDDDGGGDDDDSACCPPHPEIVQSLGYQSEDAGGSASGVTVANIDRADRAQAALAAAKSIAGSDLETWTLTRQMEDDAEGAAPSPSRRLLPFLGLGVGGTKEEGSAERGASGKIRDGPAVVVPASTTTTSTSIPRASDLGTLLPRSRKLTLVLDLDHTLLDSTGLDDFSSAEQAKGFTPDRSGDPGIGIYRLDSDNLGMLVKLRPFVGGFLKQASSMFEMHVYTLGNRVYARAAVALLDPDGVYFGGRIVSRDESTRENAKSLDVIQGAEPITVVIVDDRDDVWPVHQQDNLILTDRYRYFASTCRKSGDDIPSHAERGPYTLNRDEKGEEGSSLAVALGVLERVHQAFFKNGPCKDVREVIAEMRGQVLQGCTVAFSYLEQRMEDSPADTRLWKLAERLGAVCRKDVDETVTHVVAEDPGTQKAQWARDHGKFLVNLEWINTAGFRWCRLDEQGFPVTTMGVERRHSDLDRSKVLKAALGLLKWQRYQENHEHED